MNKQQDNEILNRALMRLSRRAEKANLQRLVQTFVDVGPLFTLISINDHQIVFGRRGTGKTHALQYLSGMMRDIGDLVSYSDLSNLGSSGGIYSNQEIPITERATRLLIDTLLDIHENLLEIFVDNAEIYDLSQTGPLLDELAEAVTQVKVTGTVEKELSINLSTNRQSTIQAGVSATPQKIGGKLTATERTDIKQDDTGKRKVTGVERHTVHFGAVRRVLEKITEVVSSHKIWLLFDEWSSIPLELQPYLADLLRRSIFPIRNITVKIAAIDYRSRFQLSEIERDYIGIEVGADASADINLDDFMVFDNNVTLAREFFKSLFHKHLVVADVLESTDLENWSADKMISTMFTQVTAFDELVRSAEGVPRDGIHIASLAAQYAVKDRISVQHIRKASKNWYQTGKEAAVHSKEKAMALLHWIVDQVIGDRKARAFMLRSNINHPLIKDLFDSRVVHILKRGISTHDEPGVRYDAYKLDYGCYVDLMTTSRAPKGLFEVSPTERSEYVDVPSDDYRSIRRAILDLSMFEDSYQRND